MVSSAPHPSVYGQSVTVTATVSAVAAGAGTPTGQVTFYADGTPLGSGTLDSSGQTTAITTGLSVATHAITATYGGASTFAASDNSASPYSQEVDKATTTTTVSSSHNPAVFGQSVTFTATIGVVAPGAGTPAGTVEFKDGSTDLSGCASQAVNTTTEQATCTTSSLSVAPHSITAYLTDSTGNFNNSDNSASPYKQTVNTAGTTTTLSSSATPAVVGQKVAFTATVAATAPGAGTPTGTVAFYDGATRLGSGTLSTNAGVTLATFATSALAVGSHPITATYTTDGNFASSTASAVTQLVRYGITLLYRPPMSGKAGSAVPIKIALVNAAGTNVSAPTVAVQALCVVVQGAATACSGAPPISYGTGSPFTFMASLAPGGGYQFNVKTTGLSSGKTYQLLVRAGSEDAGSFHAEAQATFTLTR